MNFRIFFLKKRNLFLDFVFFFLSLTFIFSFFISNLYCAIIGTNFTIQSNYLLADTENEIENDAVMENGFNFENETITCSIDSYYPIAGYLNLNGGRLHLEKDLTINNRCFFGSCGKIYGNDYSIKFPVVEENFQIPSLINKGGRFHLIDEENAGHIVYGVDWSYDDKYVVEVGSSTASYELRILYFDGNVMTVTASAELGATAYVSRWHPSEYYGAVGLEANGGYELRIFKWNVSNGTLSQTDGAEYGTYCLGASWSADGKYLATGTFDNYLRVYSFSDGLITLIDTISFAGQGYPFLDCVDWKSTGDFIVVGTESTGNDLLVYSFDGSNLALDVAIDIGFVRKVSWKPNSSLIAVALSGTTQNLQVYEHSSGALDGFVFETDSDTFYSVAWDDVHSRILAGKASVAGEELNLYYLDQNNKTISFICSDERASSIYSCRISHDENYLLMGDTGGNVSVYDMDQDSMLCRNLDMYFSSNVELSTIATFYGNCSLNGDGGKFLLNQNGKLKIEAEGQLILRNFELIGLSDNNLTCLNDNSSLILQNCRLTLTSDFTFGTGSILFSQDVVISGTNKFIYSSSMASTIDSHSILYVGPGVTFSYAPSIASRSLIYMQDDTSCLYLDGCTLSSTPTGIRLTSGCLFMDNAVSLRGQGSSISESICFGNGIETNDLNVQVLSGAEVNIHGLLMNENVM